MDTRLPPATLSIGGDLDMSTAPGVVSDVVDLLALGYRDVRLELDRLRFCDVVGAGALVGAARPGPRRGRHADPVAPRLRLAADRPGRQRAVAAAGRPAPAGRGRVRAGGPGMRWRRRDRVAPAGLHVLDPVGAACDRRGMTAADPVSPVRGLTCDGCGNPLPSPARPCDAGCADLDALSPPTGQTVR